MKGRASRDRLEDLSEPKRDQEDFSRRVQHARSFERDELHYINFPTNLQALYRHMRTPPSHPPLLSGLLMPSRWRAQFFFSRDLSERIVSASRLRHARTTPHVLVLIPTEPRPSSKAPRCSAEPRAVGTLQLWNPFPSSTLREARLTCLVMSSEVRMISQLRTNSGSTPPLPKIS